MHKHKVRCKGLHFKRCNYSESTHTHTRIQKREPKVLWFSPFTMDLMGQTVFVYEQVLTKLHMMVKMH